MNIQTIYEDDNYLVINKPAGLVVHTDGRTVEPSVVDWVKEKYPEIAKAQVGEPLVLSDGTVIEKPGIVHRIDRDTSGVLIIAKNQSAFLNLKEQFQNQEVKKEYRAVVWGELKNDEGTINRPIGRSRTNFKQWSAGRGARGTLREAVTDYRVLARKNGHSLVATYPRTGRTHQIRVHFKELNYPLVCDGLYAPKRDCPAKGLPEIKRLALHAYSVEFKGLKGEVIKAEAAYPEDFAQAVTRFPTVKDAL